MRKAWVIAGAFIVGIYATVLILMSFPDWDFRRIEACLLLDQTLADPQDALSFAFAAGDTETALGPRLLLVTAIGPKNVSAIDLSRHIPVGDHNAFDALDILGRDVRLRLTEEEATSRFVLETLLPVAVDNAHVAFGTNFSSHGAEVANEAPFAFPRLTKPTRAISELGVDQQAMLLDYEVELCMRFDRDIASLEDFDAARKAILLCGDFTDRAALLRGIPEGEDTFSGIGFTDAKSFPGAFPTGPILAIPRDWRSFVGDESISTELNTRAMQFASGSDMLMDFRAMAEFALERGSAEDWVHQGEALPLISGGGRCCFRERPRVCFFVVQAATPLPPASEATCCLAVSCPAARPTVISSNAS